MDWIFSSCRSTEAAMATLKLSKYWNTIVLVIYTSVTNFEVSLVKNHSHDFVQKRMYMYHGCTALKVT